MATLANIKQKSLVGDHIAGSVAYGRGGFANGTDFAVFTANVEFEVIHGAMFVQQFSSAVHAHRIRVKLLGNVQAATVLRGFRTPSYASAHR